MLCSAIWLAFSAPASAQQCAPYGQDAVKYLQGGQGNCVVETPYGKQLRYQTSTPFCIEYEEEEDDEEGDGEGDGDGGEGDGYEGDSGDANSGGGTNDDDDDDDDEPQCIDWGCPSGTFETIVTNEQGQQELRCVPRCYSCQPICKGVADTGRRRCRNVSKELKQHCTNGWKQRIQECVDSCGNDWCVIPGESRCCRRIITNHYTDYPVTIAP